MVDQNYSVKSVRNGLLAGYSAGICGVIVGHPLDSVKVLLQTNNGGVGTPTSRSASSNSASLSSPPAKSNAGNADTAITRAASQASSSSSTVASNASKANVSTATASATTVATPTSLTPRATSSLLGSRSLRALYAGMSGPLLTAGAIRSLNFAVYDSVRRALYQRQLQSDGTDGTSHSARHDDYLHYDSLDNVAISSFISGGATSIFTSPMVIVKTKQQIMVWGFRKAIEDTFRHGSNTQQQRPQLLKGLRNFYTGFGVHFYCDAVGTAVYFTSYEYFKRKFAERNSDEEDVSNSQVSARNISLGERILCAAGAGMVCWGVIFPADVIRSRLYAQSIMNESSMAPLTGFQLARQMVQEQGFRSLYRGVGITVARAGPVAAAVLPVYDYVLAWLSSD